MLRKVCSELDTDQPRNGPSPSHQIGVSRACPPPLHILQYRNTAREVQRLDSISKSPIYTAFSEALNGASTIQAFGATARFCSSNMDRLDFNLRAGFLSAAANRWLTIRLEFLSNILLFFTALLSVVTYLCDGTAGLIANSSSWSRAVAMILGFGVSGRRGLQRWGNTPAN